MPGAGAAARIEDLVLFIICQKFEKGGDDSIVRAMMASGLSQYLEMFLLGGGRPSCLVSYIDLEDLSDYGFAGLQRCWIQSDTFTSACLTNFPESVPSPSGEG
ncbi:hypothetical protein BK674_18390 [Pseudomonas moraviensis]|uniref:Uncharacterized protein n=1 Tax=Pseudomonas moraviensis TaxID=321662 RepID=A0A423NMB0_9PSED|nr:hypothetical protein BK674_18390 [Pseudomonas moraviensis]